MKIMTGDEVAGGDGLAYHIVYEGYPDFGPVKVIRSAKGGYLFLKARGR